MTQAHQEQLGRYDFATIEPKWQTYWREHDTFKTLNPGDADFDAEKPKCYVLDMFPYPSGAGLHVGHPVGYCATDIYSRFKRMRGFNVLHPIGFDAFGLPAEQYAIETGVHPAVTTKKNIENMRRQLKMFGFSYDWDREVTTCDPTYYKFTQWIFTRLFESWYDRRADAAKPIDTLVAGLADGSLGVTESLTVTDSPGSVALRDWFALDDDERRRVIDSERLAYIDEIPVNWCPALGTVLANEEVTNEGRSDRGDHPVFRRPLRQWMLRITRYCDRLLRELDQVDWPEPVKLMQRNWIGRSTGAEVDFPIASGGANAPVVEDFASWLGSREASFTEKPAEHVIRVYTTRPDTLYGATYMVLAPEHPLVERLTTEERRGAVDQYVASARHKSDMDRTTEAKEKTGVFTGAFAFNPVRGDRVPIWVADYVLMGYGTGAIMAVPGGDARDFEFAKAFDLDIIAVVEPTEDWCARDARLPKGSLEELRAQALSAIEKSVERWASEDEPKREQHIELAREFLKDHGDDAGLTAGVMGSLYLASPRMFEAPFTGEGVATQSPSGDTALGDDACVLNGLETAEAKRVIIEWLESRGVGRGAVHFKLRDWIFSRQKYWGEPFPVLHGENGETVSVDLADLPVELPEMTNFKPEIADDDAETLPKPPLARATEWMNVTLDGRAMVRDVNTMPQWAGSCWYYLRYLDPSNADQFCAPEAERYWMPVDLYVGGAEHAVLHLLYARFWHKVLRDLGYVTTDEPFHKLVNQGMIQAFAFRDSVGRVLQNDKVSEPEPGKFVVAETGQPATQFVAKMSKALKNVVNPDEIIAQYGADTFRLYEMFMGPIESSKPWNTRDVPGLLKLLQRIWRLVVDPDSGALSPALVDHPPRDDVHRALHKTIKSITADIEQFKFNTAIASVFEFVNVLTPLSERPRVAVETLVLLISPLAPHLAEELWSRLGHAESLAYEPWPVHDEALAKDDQVEIVVQIMGKIKSRIVVPADADGKALEAAALSDETVQNEIRGKTVRKIIVVKGRLVNIVAS